MLLVTRWMSRLFALWEQPLSWQMGIPVALSPPLEVRRDAVEEDTGEKFSFREKLHAYADFVPDFQPVDIPLHTLALADVCLALFNANEFSYVY